MATHLNAEEIAQAMSNPNSFIYKKFMNNWYFLQLDQVSHDKIMDEVMQRLILSNRAEREQWYREVQVQELTKQEYIAQLSQELATDQQNQVAKLESTPLEELITQLAKVSEEVVAINAAIAEDKIESRTIINAANAEYVDSLNEALEKAGMTPLTTEQKTDLKQRIDRGPSTIHEVVALRPDIQEQLIKDPKAIEPITTATTGICGIRNIFNLVAVQTGDKELTPAERLKAIRKVDGPCKILQFKYLNKIKKGAIKSADLSIHQNKLVKKESELTTAIDEKKQSLSPTPKPY